MAYQKIYSREYWENFPSEKTAINRNRLNNIEGGIDAIDDRVCALDTTKVDLTKANELVKEILWDESNGTLTVVKMNGSSAVIDTKLEKLAVNFTYNPQTQQLVITLDDGTVQNVDLSSLITEYEFLDSDTIAFEIAGGKVKAIVKNGSITEDHLSPDYLGEIRTQVGKAEMSAKSADASEKNAASSSALSKSYAVGGTGTRDGEDSDNAKYYAEQAKNASDVGALSEIVENHISDKIVHMTESEHDVVSKLGESSEGNLTFNGDEINAAQMTGATADKDGTSGTVPAPTAGQEGLFLRGDGTWAEAKQDLSAYYNNANYDTENNKLQLMNGDTVLKEIEISGGGGTKIVTFADGTDEEISAMIQAHYDNKINIADYWAVGDTRTVHLSAMAATGVGESHRAQTVQFVIGDFNHDDLATPINGHTKAAVTLLQKDCLMDASNASNPVNGSSNSENGYINSTDTNEGGWKNCARRVWCNNVFFAALPSVWQSMIKTVNKKVSVGNNQSTIETVQDKIFLAAEIEIFGSTTYSFAGEGTQYQYYKNATANRYKMPKKNSDSVSSAYWERSPRNATITYFCIAGSAGSAGGIYASGVYGIAPNFCI